MLPWKVQTNGYFPALLGAVDGAAEALFPLVSLAPHAAAAEGDERTRGIRSRTGSRTDRSTNPSNNENNVISSGWTNPGALPGPKVLQRP
jgi:hypothetical protein